ncbi:MAG: hypothetical protein EZS28_021167 [Streblomastix strix]|uniref:Rad60/SUMO-like domain-containing protein n=1 Tax=Streblomastix strix TaxID=222440 RepID=A0A5J4VKY8_9EUKA|nr:MAG: hypothetical protein EZS28_021167 [Streblomastix strix]
MAENKPSTGKGPFLTIIVRTPTGEEIFFKIREKTPLKKVIEAYCNSFDGQRIKDIDSPYSLDMQENDVIDALVEFHGGC